METGDIAFTLPLFFRFMNWFIAAIVTHDSRGGSSHICRVTTILDKSFLFHPQSIRTTDASIGYDQVVIRRWYHTWVYD